MSLVCNILKFSKIIIKKCKTVTNIFKVVNYILHIACTKYTKACITSIKRNQICNTFQLYWKISWDSCAFFFNANMILIYATLVVTIKILVSKHFDDNYALDYSIYMFQENTRIKPKNKSIYKTFQLSRNECL